MPKGIPRDPETTRERRSKPRRQYKKRPPVSFETRRRQSETMKLYWENLSNEEKREHVSKIRKSTNAKPNSTENSLLQTLENLFPGEWTYNNWQLILGGKVPDFVNINGQKKLIELFGVYWHTPEDEIEKAEIYTSLGYELLVVWEYELGTSNLENKLKEFCEVDE